MSARLILLLTICFIGCNKLVYSQTQCRDRKHPRNSIFQYLYNHHKQKYYGYITLKDLKPGDNIELDVTLSVAAFLPTSFKGRIRLAETASKASRNIANGKYVHLYVLFPKLDPPPGIVSITQQGETICRGGQTYANDTSDEGIRSTWKLTYEFFPDLTVLDINSIVERRYAQSYESTTTSTGRPSTRSTSTEDENHFYPHNVANAKILTTSRETTLTISSESKCGQTKRKVLNKLMFNGENTERGQFPWSVPLFELSKRTEPTFICGSTLISTKHLISAAHCVDQRHANQMLAFPGLHNIEDFGDPDAVRATVKSIIPHEDYVSEENFDAGHDADIAILLLTRDMPLTDYIRPVCMWREKTDISSILGKTGQVSGWGFIQTGSTATPYHTTNTTVSRQECINNWGRHIHHADRVFCGDGNGTAPCNGDSGGGLVIKRGNQYYLRGVVSIGIRDPETLLCDTKKYALYTDVARFRYWIRDYMDNNN